MRQDGQTNRKPTHSPSIGCARTDDPWELVWGQPYIDVNRLAAALEQDLQNLNEPDFRTRLLVRDCAKAMRSFWGARRFAAWLQRSPVGERIRSILQEDLGKPGYRHIRSRLVANVNSADVEQVLLQLGAGVHGRVEINIAGSIPTLLGGLTARPTDDIDIVDEVPAEIRKQRAMLREIKAKFGLSIGHVQSHYLPANWQSRRQFLGDFGGIRAYLVDPCDIFVSKLSSKLEKHKDDLRVMAKKLDKETARKRMLSDGKAFIEDKKLRPQIEANWQFVFRDDLFPTNSGAGTTSK